MDRVQDVVEEWLSTHTSDAEGFELPTIDIRELRRRKNEEHGHVYTVSSSLPSL